MTAPKRNFSNFIDGFLEYTKDHESPLPYKIWTALSVLAGTVERRLWYSDGFITTYPNLYVFIVGDRGVGKSVMTNIGIELLDHVKGITMAANKINESSLVKKLITTGKENNFEFMGQSYHSSSVYIYASEALSTFQFGYSGASIIPLLTDLFNCTDSPWSKQSKWAKSTMKDGESAVYNPCINLLACSTPQWLMQKILTKDDIEGGFGSRCVLIVHEGPFEFTNGIKSNSIERESMRAKLLQDLNAIRDLKGCYTVDPSWQKAQMAYAKQHSAFLNYYKHKNPMIASCLARKTSTYLMKLSILLAAAEGPELVLHKRHCDKAWELMTALEHSLPYAFKEFGNNYEVQHTQDVWSYLQSCSKVEFTKREIYVVFAGRYGTKKCNDALNDLRNQGRIEYNISESKLPHHVVFSRLDRQSPGDQSPPLTQPKSLQLPD